MRWIMYSRRQEALVCHTRMQIWPGECLMHHNMDGFRKCWLARGHLNTKLSDWSYENILSELSQRPKFTNSSGCPISVRIWLKY
jgi:hypothetical protein